MLLVLFGYFYVNLQLNYKGLRANVYFGIINNTADYNLFIYLAT